MTALEASPDLSIILGRWSVCERCESKSFLARRGRRYEWICTICGTCTATTKPVDSPASQSDAPDTSRPRKSPTKWNIAQAARAGLTVEEWSAQHGARVRKGWARRRS